MTKLINGEEKTNFPQQSVYRCSTFQEMQCDSPLQKQELSLMTPLQRAWLKGVGATASAQWRNLTDTPQPSDALHVSAPTATDKATAHTLDKM